MRRTSFTLTVMAVIWTFVLLMIFRREWNREDERVLRIAVSQARSSLQRVVDVRNWNTSHGGVYVEISRETPPNPYLTVPYRDLVTSDGKRLTLINPAYMTRQLGEVALKNRGVAIHLTSLKPLRPDNAPDPWEEEALRSFESGLEEAMNFHVDDGGRNLFRYMTPLKIEHDCISCHEEQGYREGDIGGGLSIMFPVDALVEAKTSLRKKITAAATVIWLMGLGLMVVVDFSLARRRQLTNKLQELSQEDELTGLYNRRGFLKLAGLQLQVCSRAEQKGLLLFIDLDLMKHINDAFGHKEGDEALIRVSRILRSTFRESDIIARFGGDEFIVFCPNTSADRAEDILTHLKGITDIEASRLSKPYRLSISAGYAEFNPFDPCSLEKLINTADRRMYSNKKAKQVDANTP